MYFTSQIYTMNGRNKIFSSKLWKKQMYGIYLHWTVLVIWLILNICCIINSFEWINHQSEAGKYQSDKSIKNGLFTWENGFCLVSWVELSSGDKATTTTTVWYWIPN